MYLALAPVIAIALGLVTRAGRALRAPVLLPVALAAAAGLAFRTAERNRDYRSELALWQDTTGEMPDNARAHYYLGLALHRAGRTAEACAWAEELVRRLGDQGREDIAISATWELRREIQTGRRDLRGCAAARAASLRRSLRYQGFRIDPLPFA